MKTRPRPRLTMSHFPSMKGKSSPTVAQGIANLTGMKAPKRSKYGNHKVEICGMMFDSKREGNRYIELGALQKRGLIKDLRRQVKYDLRVNGVLVATYRADFVYKELVDELWIEVVEDAKGYPNDRWAMKKKLMLACHGIKIREV